MADNSGCTIWLYNGSDTYTALSQAPLGFFLMTGVSDGVYRIRFQEQHHLGLLPADTITISGGDTHIGAFGPLLAGDADSDNRITIFDGARVKASLGIVNPDADIDRNATVNEADLNWVRINFGRRGDDF